MPGQKTTTRQKIIQAAIFVAIDNGKFNFTIESVAKKAELSKGGVLHHFPNKDSLITAMVESSMKNFELQIGKYQKKDSEPLGSWIRSYVRASFFEQKKMQQISVALLSAVIENPELLKPLKKRYKSLQSIIEKDNPNAALATLIRLAADGLWYAELFGIAAPNPKMKKEILEILLKLSKK